MLAPDSGSHAPAWEPSSKHGLDFADAEKVFDGPTATDEDARVDYGGQRFNTIGLLGVKVVVITHTETDEDFTSSPCARHRNMKSNPSSPCSDDAPEFTLEKMRNARLRVGLKDVSREEWQASLRQRPSEPLPLNVILDPDVASWLKQRADASEFNVLINSILRKAIQSTDLEDVLHKHVQEELQQV